MAEDKPISVLDAATDPGDGWYVEALDPTEPLDEDKNKRVSIPNLRAAKIRITEATNGFSPMESVGHDGANWVLAQAGTQAADGIVLDTDDGDTFVLGLPGYHTVASHGVTIGQRYLSKTTAGGNESAPPIGGPVQRIMKAIDSNTLLVQIGDYA